MPRGFSYVVGDNREHSYDSRAYGPIPVRNLAAIDVVHAGHVELDTLGAIIGYGVRQIFR